MGGSLFQFSVLVLAGFCMFYCFDGLLRERPFEILAYVAASTVIIVYIIANFSVTGWEEQPLRIVSQVALTPWWLGTLAFECLKLPHLHGCMHVPSFFLPWVHVYICYLLLGQTCTDLRTWAVKHIPCSVELVEDGLPSSECHRVQHYPHKWVHWTWCALCMHDHLMCSTSGAYRIRSFFQTLQLFHLELLVSSKYKLRRLHVTIIISHSAAYLSLPGLRKEISWTIGRRWSSHYSSSIPSVSLYWEPSL